MDVNTLNQQLEALRQRRDAFQQAEQAAIAALRQQLEQRVNAANMAIGEMNAHEVTLLRLLEILKPKDKEEAQDAE